MRMSEPHPSTQSENMSIQEGGPAFPCMDRGDGFPGEGMSLRDYFAAAALTGQLANPKNTLRFDPEHDADFCYRIADAMLARRYATPGQPSPESLGQETLGL